MKLAFALLSGILFGIGLTVAGMTNPQKILNFLDVAAIASGKWDPTLLMVFIGALPVMFVAYRLQAKASSPWHDASFWLPLRQEIDAPLVGGSALFGIGWGLVGLCPGPAIAALILVDSRPRLGAALLFAGAMLLGVWLAYATRRSGSEREVAAV